jgi:hypothetical protein
MDTSSSKGSDDSKEKEPPAAPPQPNPADLVHLHKMKINTELCCKRYDFLTKKTQNYRYQNYCPG